MPSIRTESLCFSYGGNDILHDIDLDIEGKGLVCIIGPNGVGKSTLIKCFNGLLRPTSGTVSVNGRPVGDYSVKELSELIGYVPSSTTMSFPMSVIDSVLLGRDSKSKWKLDPSDVLAAYRALKVMRLDDMALRNCNALSAGQMQKVNICRGLVRDSDIFILDEPTSNLDIKHQVFITSCPRVSTKRWFWPEGSYRSPGSSCWTSRRPISTSNTRWTSRASSRSCRKRRA